MCNKSIDNWNESFFGMCGGMAQIRLYLRKHIAVSYRQISYEIQWLFKINAIVSFSANGPASVRTHLSDTINEITRAGRPLHSSLKCANRFQPATDRHMINGRMCECVCCATPISTKSRRLTAYVHFCCCSQWWRRNDDDDDWGDDEGAARLF